MPAETELQFDGWTVNRVSGEIARDGRASRLPQQPLRILIELADRAGEIVTREQLVKVLWPGGIVDFDNGLNVAMRKLRVALDDVGDAPRYIETLPRVGYRFIVTPGAMAPDVPPVPARAGNKRMHAVMAATLITLSAAIAGTWWWNGRIAQHEPSARALELYLEGIHHRSRRDIAGLDIALGKFQEALKEDPNYPQAWAAVAESFSVAVIRQKMTPAEGVPRARAAVQRALDLDDDTFEAHATLGQIYLDHDRNYAAADRAFKRALELNGRAARLWHHIAMWHGHLGQVDEALAALRRARELEPMTLLWHGHYGLMLYKARRYDEAVAFLKPLVASNARFDQARSVLGRAMMATGDLVGAQEQLGQIVERGVNQSDLGLLYAKLGRRDDALREIEKLGVRAAEGFGVAYDQAIIHAALGELDLGCKSLARAVEDHSLLLGWMRLDPRMDPLRDRRCFTDVAKLVYALL